MMWVGAKLQSKQVNKAKEVHQVEVNIVGNTSYYLQNNKLFLKIIVEEI